MAEVLAVRGTLRLGARSLPVDLATEARRIGVVGPSGAGKSTLLRAIAGLAPVQEVRVRGTLWTGGHGGPPHVSPVPPWQRGVGFVPQDPTLFPHATVRQNLGWSDPNAPVDALAAALGLTPLLDRMPRNLSGGERQRVALGRGLLAARSILLLDEPFSALDRARRDDVARFVDGWARERDLPLVLVSHDSRDVEALTDEVFEVSEGGFRAAR
jgi:ABC-type molybdate transport system ATPase subunit